MDVRGKSVLVLGDSLTHRGARTQPDGVDVTESSSRSGSPGDLLASYLLEAGARTARINGRVSRSAVNFWKGNNGEAGGRVLAEESAQRRPELVFVFLGTNDLGMDPSADARGFQLIDETFRANGAYVVAIGPPSFASVDLQRKAETVYLTLRQVFGARVIDLRPLTTDVLVPSQGRSNDGIHFGSTGARKVAARLAAAVIAFGRPFPARVTVRPWLIVGVAVVAAATAAGAAVLWRRRRVPQARRPSHALSGGASAGLGLSLQR